MAQLFEIKKVTVGPKNLDAVVELAPNAPVMTHEDLEGTTRVWEVMPQLRDHVCLGDESGNFGEVMGSTELAHLLEHVTVELLARTDIAGDIPCGQTAEVGERTYKLTFKCADDVLVVGALSSAAWIMQWAFSGGGEPRPDVDAIAAGLTGLVGSLPEPEPRDEDEIIAGPEPVAVDEAVEGDTAQVEAPAPVVEPAPAVADEPAPAPVEAAEFVPEPVAAAPVVDESEVEAILAAEPVAVEPAPEPVEPAAEPAPAEECVPVEAYEDVVAEENVAEEVEVPQEDEVFEPEANEEVDAEPEPVDESFVPEPEPEPVVEPDPVEEPIEEPVAEPEPEPAADPAPAANDDWGMENVPRPRLVR